MEHLKRYLSKLKGITAAIKEAAKAITKEIREKKKASARIVAAKLIGTRNVLKNQVLNQFLSHRYESKLLPPPPPLPALTYESTAADDVISYIESEKTQRIHRKFTYDFNLRPELQDSTKYNIREILDIAKLSFFFHRRENEDLLPYYITVRFIAVFINKDGEEKEFTLASGTHRRPEALVTDDETLRSALTVCNQEIEK